MSAVFRVKSGCAGEGLGSTGCFSRVIFLFLFGFPASITTAPSRAFLEPTTSSGGRREHLLQLITASFSMMSGMQTLCRWG